jgi:hypothetical protein
MICKGAGVSNEAGAGGWSYYGVTEIVFDHAEVP